jgi:hypothetical protein
VVRQISLYLGPNPHEELNYYGFCVCCWFPRAVEAKHSGERAT